MTDRWRINGPPSGTAPPVFASALAGRNALKRPQRTRNANEIRKIFLQTGLTPSASGSAYLELSPSQTSNHSADTLIPSTSSLKLTCAVHGPKPLPRSAPFSPQLVLSTNVKFAPFATRQRKGYIRDTGERDLGIHLESALRGVVIAERWPKSGIEVVITVLEAEEDRWWADDVLGQTLTSGNGIGGLGMLTVLAGCITVASAAIIDAGIDCVDMVNGGVAAVVKAPSQDREAIGNSSEEKGKVILDPCPSEHDDILACCVVGYLPNRDELTLIWMKGDIGGSPEALTDRAVEAALMSNAVLAEALKESVMARLSPASTGAKEEVRPRDVDMNG